MEDIKKQIEDIREINRQHKLVVFVGAGVSRNSGICSWWELVKEMAVKINYHDICDKCEMKSLMCSECGEDLELCSFNGYNCVYKYNFSSDELLKIPQYFFEEKGETVYYEFLKEKFCKEYSTNAINEMIVGLEPEHIITTNYDHLIENVKNPSISDYAVIKSDNDLLAEKTGRKYIIKMHGDIDDIQNIVLKEDDYLNYSKSHELIEMYIKSLLIDKTFLFVGYSLSDNNLKLILSYINHFADILKTKRFNNYLVTGEVIHEERELKYWENKKIKIVNLSNVSNFMINKTPCNLQGVGQLLYTFLKYLRDDKLAYFEDETTELKNSLLKNMDTIEPFNRISYTTLLSICAFSQGAELLDGVLIIVNIDDYNNLCSIFSQDDADDQKIKQCFLKAGVHNICHRDLSYDLGSHEEIVDELFDLSIRWDFSRLYDKLSSDDNTLEKVYYYSLIFKTKNAICLDLLSSMEIEINKMDFKCLTIEDKYKISILEYNQIAVRSLNEYIYFVREFEKELERKSNEINSFECNEEAQGEIRKNIENKLDELKKEQWHKLNRLLESASNQSKAFEFIKKICKNDGETLNELNNILIKHEEYYMKKETMMKLGGTVYGDLLKLQAIVYDYYYFYKKNYLMLDWFNNVSKICGPYIRAILCTYYPDEYQYSRMDLGRTQVEQYPLNILDLDMLVRHVRFKDFKSWISYYKVSHLKLIDNLDIVTIFNNFCITAKKYWVIEYDEYINNFGMILSLLTLSSDECHDIIKSYIDLVIPNDKFKINMLRSCIRSLWLFIDKHYDSNEKLNYELLNLLIDERLIADPLDMRNDYVNLIRALSPCSDVEIYKKCCDIISNCNSNRKKAYYPYILIDILLEFDEKKWKLWVKENIDNNWTEEIFYYLEKKIILFDKDISTFFESKLEGIKRQKGVYITPNNKTELINTMVVLIILGIIPSLNEVEYLKKYCDESNYLDFLFNPSTFDYSKIETADYMWCNFINSSNYREIILKHKSDFWNENKERRIELGFGGNFENRVAYKYLFD